MRKSLLYMIILAAVLVLPTKATDVGKLRPVQTLAVYKDGTDYVIETDTKDAGRGESIQLAIMDLKATTPGIIYLDTAQHLLVRRESDLKEMQRHIKDSVQVYVYEGVPPMEKVSQFLTAHPTGISMKKWEKGTKLPLLDCTKDRLKIFVK